MNSLSSVCEYAILHREHDAAHGLVDSDIDVVVDRDVFLVAQDMAKSAEELALIGFSEYDVGGLATFWVSTLDFTVAQIDLLHDPAGSGRYGLLTAAALGSAQPGVRWRRVADSATSAYLLSKRSHKGQDVSELAAVEPADLARFLTPRRSRELHLIPQEQTVFRDGRRLEARVRRLARRMSAPTSFRVQFIGDDATDACAEAARQLSGYVPHTAVAMTTREYLGALAFLARRPSLILTSASTAPRPHLRLSADASNDEPRRMIVSAMSAMAAARLLRAQARRGGSGS